MPQNAAAVEMWNTQPDGGCGPMPVEDRPITYDELRAQTQQSQFDQVRDMVPFWMKGVEAAEKGEVLRLEEFLDKLAAENRWGLADINDPWGPSVGPWPVSAAPAALAEDPWAQTGADGWGANTGDGWANNADGGWGGPTQKMWGKTNGWNTRKQGDCIKLKDQWGAVAGWAVDNDSTLSAQPSQTSPRHNLINKSGRKNKKGHNSHRDPHLFVEKIARQQDVDVERKRRMHAFCEVCALS